MALDTFVVIANQYGAEADAVADYEDVRVLYKDLGLIDTYDAAVLTRDAHGKVKIVKRVEEPTRQVGAVGLVGAGAGAAAGHVAAGMSRKDLKELGELLDDGSSGLIVVAATDVESRVNAVLKRAKKQAKADLQADTDALKKELDAL